MFHEKSIKNMLLSNDKLAAMDPSVVDTQNRIDIFHALCSDIGEFLDFGCGVFDLSQAEVNFESER